jgi:hypothetical protein
LYRGSRCSRYCITSLIAVHWLAACAQPLIVERSLATLPYQVEPGGRIVVEVRVNDRGPYRFAIDTAATGSFAFSRMVTELGLEPIPGITSTVYGAVATGSFPVIAVDRLEIGGEIWENAQLTALPGRTNATSTLDGILGADFLRRYSVGFSVRTNTANIYRPETIAERSYRGWTAIRTDPRFFGASQEPLRYIEIELEGESLFALLDLGSGISILNSEAVRNFELRAVGGSDESVFSGAIENLPLIARLTTQRVRTGLISWRNENFLIGDFEIFETLRSTETPLAILGSGLFHQRDFIVDFTHERLLVRAAMDEIEVPIN